MLYDQLETSQEMQDKEKLVCKRLANIDRCIDKSHKCTADDYLNWYKETYKQEMKSYILNLAWPNNKRDLDCIQDLVGKINP